MTAADLSLVAVLVPVRGLERAKARLGEALDPEERAVLIERLLRRVVAAATGAAGVDRVAVVSPDRAALDIATAGGAAAVEDAGTDLNAALDAGRSWARSIGATALLVLPADLPMIDAAAIAAILDRGREAIRPAPGSGPRALVVLVPDHAGTGTNALLLSPPDVISFAFGGGSRAAHAAAARRAGARYLEIGGPLRVDLDLPDDLLLAGETGRTLDRP